MIILRNVNTIGVTGTNGKTSITYIVEAILKKASKKVAVIGTVNQRVGKKVFPSKNTTPSFIENQEWFLKMKKTKVQNCVMEVSSHALDQGRVDLIDFDTAIFTNLKSDHLDYHKSVNKYFLAKSKLFKSLLPASVAIINNDDSYASKLISLSSSKIVTYGINKKACFMARNIKLSLKGSIFDLVYPYGQEEIKTKLIGMHNIYNILPSIAVGVLQGIPIDIIKKGIQSLKSIPGRLEKVDCKKDYSVLIDYAHSEDALLNVLKTLRNIQENNIQSFSGKIILLFGCGGDRDQTKRPKMGTVASTLADYSIVTSDNPRSENPKTIIHHIIKGFRNNDYKIISNRKKAIQHALKIASRGDIVLIAGKGHESYQMVKNKCIKFDEKEIIREALNV